MYIHLHSNANQLSLIDLNSFLCVEGVSKSYGNARILVDINLEVEKGEFFFLLGPSGCGKTTLLRSISGLVDHESGNIFLDGKQIDQLPAHLRDVNTVFQNYALFPHMNVADNVGFGLKMKKRPSSEIAGTVAQMLELVGLSNYQNRFPSQLSGGQMQRVALARALANKPSLLLLDEPLGALDVKLRKQMQNELRRIQKEVGVTFICVTHDQEEALSIGDRIAVMNKGKLEQIGSSEELYHSPKTKFVCDFLGESNFIELQEATVGNSHSFLNSKKSGLILSSTLKNVSNPNFAAIRPEHVSISSISSSPETNINTISAKVIDIRFSGPFFDVTTVSEDGLNLVSRVSSNTLSLNFELGSDVILTWSPDSVILLDA